MKKFLIIIVCFIGTYSFAQSTISGSIVDSSKNPIPGVNVQLVGTPAGTTTDFDGKYAIQLKAGKKSLEFSFFCLWR